MGHRIAPISQAPCPRGPRRQTSSSHTAQPLFSHCEWGLPRRRRADSPVGKTGRSAHSLRSLRGSLSCDTSQDTIWICKLIGRIGAFEGSNPQHSCPSIARTGYSTEGMVMVTSSFLSALKSRNQYTRVRGRAGRVGTVRGSMSRKGLCKALK